MPKPLPQLTRLLAEPKLGEDMDPLAHLALITKAKLVFESSDTFLSFPALSPLSYPPEHLKFDKLTSTQEMLVFSEFCRLTNTLPEGVLFQPSVGSFLWDAYHNVLQTAEIAQGDLTPEQNADLQKALGFLYVQTADGLNTPSQALVAYRQYRDAWIKATQNYRAQELTANSASDPNLKAQWQSTDEPLLRAEVQTAEDDWETKGFKAQVEQAQQVEQTCAALAPQLKWQSWSSQFNPDLDMLTDPSNQSFAVTAFSPSDVIDQTDWLTFTIVGSEIPQLVNRAPEEVKNIFGTDLANSTIDSLSFEFCSVAVDRNWLRPELFDARFWRFSDPSMQLSDGMLQPKGQWPAYITGLVFARNIVVAEHSDTGTVQKKPIQTFTPIRTSTPITLRPVLTQLTPIKPSSPQPNWRMALRPIVLARLNTWRSKNAPAQDRSLSMQENWQWCDKCHGLAFAGDRSPGRCPAGGLHDHQGSWDYALVMNVPGAAGQHDWRWCNKCQGLAFAGNRSPGPCPAGGLHDHKDSGDYTLVMNVPGAAGQHNWRWCNKCQGLGFAGGPSPGACPAGGLHDYRLSGDYSLTTNFRRVPAAPAQVIRVAPTSGPVGSPQQPLAHFQIPQPAVATKPPPNTVSQEQPASDASISILAFICKRLAKCPNPDPTMTWSTTSASSVQVMDGAGASASGHPSTAGSSNDAPSGKPLAATGSTSTTAATTGPPPSGTSVASASGPINAPSTQATANAGPTATGSTSTTAATTVPSKSASPGAGASPKPNAPAN
jgi:hypothetical protein